MRTKTLLLAAALTAAGIATSMAQVYSVNAVGYVKTTLKPGFNLISNPLNATSNKIQDLFANIDGGIPTGLTVFKFTNGSYSSVAYDPDLGGWDNPDVAGSNIELGDGVFVLNPLTTDKVVTFVGEVPQGARTTQLPQGFSIKSSQVPQAGVVDTVLGLPLEAGETVYQYNPATSSYSSATYDPDLGGWDTSTGAGPSIKVGEAFFLFRPTAGTWTRNFNVNSQ